jgi:hypothetical protein
MAYSVARAAASLLSDLSHVLISSIDASLLRHNASNNCSLVFSFSLFFFSALSSSASLAGRYYQRQHSTQMSYQ